MAEGSVSLMACSQEFPNHAGIGDTAWPQTMAEFERLVDTMQDQLVRYAFRRLGNLGDAEDAVQEVFIKVYADRAKRRQVANVRAYLYRMASNHCSDLLRKRKIQIVSMEELHEDEMPVDFQNGVKEIDAAKDLQRIENMLGHIPPKQAEVVRLRLLDELSPTEIAKMLGTPLTAIKSRLRHGLEKLREMVVSSAGGKQP